MAAYSQSQVQASLAANPYASKGGYEGQAPMQSTPYGRPKSTVAPGSLDAAGQYAGASGAYQRALVRFNQQRTGLLQQYGYRGTVDPTSGMITNLGVDTGNAHGLLQQMLGGQDNADQAALNAAEDRGLHGGLANQGESAQHAANMGQSGALGQALTGSLTDLNSQQQDAQGALDEALWQLQHSAASNAVDSGNFTPAPVDDGAGAPPPPNTVAPKSKSKAPAAKSKARVLKSIARRNTSGAGIAKKIVANAYLNGRKKRG